MKNCWLSYISSAIFCHGAGGERGSRRVVLRLVDVAQICQGFAHTHTSELFWLAVNV